MDYEKTYREALERAKLAIKECGNNKGRISMIESSFPELRESEDERIRKDIMVLVKDWWDRVNKDNISTKEQMIAWLEKQGGNNNQNWKPSKSQINALEHFVMGVAESGYASPYDDNTKLLKSLMNDLRKLEEQGEQKPILDFKASNWYVSEVDGKIHDLTYNPADKVEPKFKVGDWILYSGDHYEGVRHITKIDENGYYIERNGLPHGIIPFNHEICMRLWSIQDAKNGDILVNGSNIFIFHFINGTRLMGYCHVNTDDGRFYDDIGKNECFCLIDGEVNPATKEQRDLLFSKMKEAGYEWDAEKKELKKIEEDGVAYKKQVMSEMANLATAYIKQKSQPAWSEKDEIGFSDTLWAIQQARTIAKDENDMGNLWYAEDWLKSLKYRYMWKPTKENVEAVRLARSFVTDDFSENPTLSEILIDLEEQLKKLIDE